MNKKKTPNHLKCVQTVGGKWGNNGLNAFDIINWYINYNIIHIFVGIFYSSIVTKNTGLKNQTQIIWIFLCKRRLKPVSLVPVSKVLMYSLFPSRAHMLYILNKFGVRVKCLLISYLIHSKTRLKVYLGLLNCH